MDLTIGLVILSVAASAATIYLFAEEMRSRRRFGWKQVEHLVKHMLAEMRSRGYKPDLVLGIGRGGAILAGLLAGNLGHIPLAVLDTELDKSSGFSSARIRFPDTCPTVHDKSVLIVVGELYSGEDLREGIEFIRCRNPRDIRTASLLTHPAASVRPDFIGLETAKPLNAPWRLTDAYKSHRL